MKKYKCEICGGSEDSEMAMEIYHRGCRFRQVFERAEKQEKELGMEKSGFMLLDITKFKAKNK